MTVLLWALGLTVLTGLAAWWADRLDERDLAQQFEQRTLRLIVSEPVFDVEKEGL